MTDSGGRDCLSVCFSFLATREFARAIRCCKFWYLVGCQNTSWPRVSVDVQAMTKFILANDYAGSSVRRISVNVNQARLRCGLMRARHSPFWSKVKDLHIWTGGYYRQRQSFVKPPKRYGDVVLQAVSYLRHLKVLNLGLSRASHNAVHECFTRLAPTLECLLSNVPSTPVVASLALLTGLRVLVIRVDRSKSVAKQMIGQGPASQLAVALLALTQLTTLHYEDEQVESGWWDAPVELLEGEERVSSEAEACQVVAAARELSVHHALRAFSFHWRHSVLTHDPAGVFDLSMLAGQGAAAVAAQLDLIQLDMNPTASILVCLSSLPALSKLEWHCAMDELADVIRTLQRSTSSVLSSSSLRFLRLRNRQRDTQPPCPVMRRSVIEFLITMAPELEELHLIHVELRADEWALLPQWCRLRVLHLCASLELTMGQIRVLRRWRSWQVIHLYPARSCGCHWRLMRQSLNPSPLNGSNNIIRLIQDAPPDADEHGHCSGEYQLRLTEEELMNSSTDTCPEWYPMS